MKQKMKNQPKTLDKMTKIVYHTELVRTNRPAIRVTRKTAENVCPKVYQKLYQVETMNLTAAQEGQEYIIKAIETDDEELDAFLFSLGCYSGEPITVIAHRKGGCVVSIKDARYSIDTQLAEAILI